MNSSISACIVASDITSTWMSIATEKTYFWRLSQEEDINLVLVLRYLPASLYNKVNLTVPLTFTLLKKPLVTLKV